MTPLSTRLSKAEGVNPYLIHGPALISFSGGRTSAYMLRMILDAHGGTLPEDVHVCFANTGKEREETLRFVHECATAWGVRVRWLEWKSRPMGKEGRATPPAERFEEVGYNSASRNGEPFAAVIQRRQFLPNAVTRFCTSALKIDTMKMFMRAQGYDRWLNAVGLRAVEMRRVTKQTMRNEAGNERWTTIMPLAKAGVRKEDVMAFWRTQPFDLQLQPHEGNCDLCFLKSKAALLRMISENPALADWWAKQESLVAPKKPSGARFVTEYSYRDLADEAHDTPRLPLGDDDYDVECGLGGSDHTIRCGRRAA